MVKENMPSSNWTPEERMELGCNLAELFLDKVKNHGAIFTDPGIIKDLILVLSQKTSFLEDNRKVLLRHFQE